MHTAQSHLEANRFAYNLLMPKGKVKWAVRNGKTIDEMSELFGVEKQKVKNRLIILGFMDGDYKILRCRAFIPVLF